MQTFDHGSSFLRFSILLISGGLIVAASIRGLFLILLLIIHQTVHHIIIGFGTGKPIPKYLDQEMERKRG